MNPKLCPVCVGRGSVPKDLYHAPLPKDWEPGEYPAIREDCPETECRTCEGLGVIWPPETDSHGSVFDSDGEFTYTTPTSRVYVTSTRMSYTDLYDWDAATNTDDLKPSLSLVSMSEDEDD